MTLEAFKLLNSTPWCDLEQTELIAALAEEVVALRGVEEQAAAIIGAALADARQWDATYGREEAGLHTTRVEQLRELLKERRRS